MAERRGRSRHRASTRTFDSTIPQNWTLTKLKVELKTIGISVPSSMDRNNTLKLYLENTNTRNRSVNSLDPNRHIDTITAIANPTIISNCPNSANDEFDNSRPFTVTEALRNTGDANLRSDNSTSAQQFSNMAAPEPDNIQATLQSLQKNLETLQKTVSELVKKDHEEKSYTLETARGSSTTAVGSGFTGADITLGGSLRTTQFGVSAECLPQIDIVSDSLKRKIWEGRDVNLASLLIPKYEVNKSVPEIAMGLNVLESVDPRLHKSLTISEFITAFGKYKRIMCTRFPERRVELDRYEGNIVEISNVYGQKFYDYHTQFSARAAAALHDLNIKVDWSIKDNALLSMVMGNARVSACNLCNSTSHSGSFCPLLRIKPTQYQMLKNTQSINSAKEDKYGRPRKMHNGTEICNNFNAGKCGRKNCIFSHVCYVCKASDHGGHSCEESMRKGK